MPVNDEETVDEHDDDEHDEEELEAEAAAGGDEPAPKDGEPVESSLEELLAKRAPEEAKAAEEEEDESMLAVERDDRVETLAVKVIPQQPTEFVCKKCFLVKHRSQLADKRRMFCRDCA